MEANLSTEYKFVPDLCPKSDCNERDATTQIANKLSYRKWRNEFKKLKRKARRRELAQIRDATLLANSEERELSGNETVDEEQDHRRIEHELWLEREKEAQIKFLAKKDREEKERLFREEEQRKIKDAWAEEKRKRKEEEDEKKTKDGKKLKENINQLQQKKNDTWQNPPAPPGYNAEHQEVNNCPFFQKVGACRFGINCKRAHNVPETSSTLLFPGMFTHFELEQSFRDEFDSDLTLEYEEGDIYEEFKLFYEDVFPEFETTGHVTRFIVCCNYEPHLRGNVYVQFASKEEAMSAFEKFNGRWYCKRQLSCQFTAVDNWKSAICGLFHHKKCPKGKNCNFLHVFQNPVPLRHIKSSGHTRERPENSWQDKHSRHRSHYKSSSRSSKKDFDSSSNQLSLESHEGYRLKSSAENGKSRMSSKYSKSSHHGHSYSRSRDRQSSHRTNRSKSRSSKCSRRSVFKVSTLDQSYSSSNSPSASEQCRESQTSENSPSKSSKVSHKEHHLLSKALSKSCHEHCTSQSHKKHKRSKSHKHHHHSKDKSAPKHHVEDGSKKSPTYLCMIHQPSKSVHLVSDSELGADKEDKATYSRRNKIRENLSTDSDVESVPMSSGVDKCLNDHELHQEGDDVEEQYHHTIAKKRKRRRVDHADAIR